MTKVIESISEQQWEEVFAIRDKWLTDIYTEERDPVRVAEAFHRVSVAAISERPPVILVDDLDDLYVHELMLSLIDTDEEREQVDYVRWPQIFKDVEGDLVAFARECLGEERFNENVVKKAKAARRSPERFLREGLTRVTGETVLRQLNFMYLGAYAGWFEAAQHIGVEFDADNYRDLVEYATLCPLAVHSTLGVFVLNIKTPPKWEDRLLHCEDGPAFHVGESIKLWAIRGVLVDEQVVMRPETQTLEQINSEENEEVKRVRIERYGWEKYLKEMDAKPIDHQRNDIEQTDEVLMQCGDMRVLMCACPSTAKIFFLEVDPSISTCDAAQKWLHSGSTLDEMIGATRVIGRS